MELHIYGYGKLENVKITDIEKLQVFYGENEAGKSTIMSFIHSILFGFPTKQQAELRYEPKKNSKYGGLVKVRFPDSRTAIIERVKGKASGDVTVTLENGVIGGEELLTELLGGMDKGTFQAIFSFNLQGLQNAHQLKGEELGRYLFSAGALGTDKLLQAENQLQKEMELRFKPSGRKPILNEKIKELRQVYEEVKKAENENDEYDQLLVSREATSKRLAELQTELTALEHRVFKLTEMERMMPLIVEENGLERKLENSGDVLFPVNGLLRLERLGEQQQRVQARLAGLIEQIDRQKKEAERLQPNEDLLAHETEVSSQLEDFPYFNQLSQEQEQLQLRIRELNEEMEHLSDLLHMRFTEETILKVNTSVAVKETAEELQLKGQQLKERKLTLDESFQDEKRAMEELEKTAESIGQQLLVDRSRTELAKKLQTLGEQEKLKDEQRRIQDQIDAFKRKQAAASKQKQESQKQQSLQMLLLGLIFLLLIGGGIWTQQWILLGAGIVGLLLVLFMYFRSAQLRPEMDVDEETLAVLVKREQEVSTQLKRTEGLNLSAVRDALEQDNQNRNRFREVAARLEQQKDRYEMVIKSFEKWETEGAELNRSLAQLAEKLMLPMETGTRKIYDSVLLIEKQKQMFREKSRIENKLLEIGNKRKELSSKYDILAERFLHNRDLHVQDMVVLLRKKLRGEIDLKAKHREVLAKLSEFKDESRQLEKELQQLNEEESVLFKLAHVEDEEGFRNRAQQAEQLSNWQDKLAKLTLQLEAAGITVEEREKVQQGTNPREQLEQAQGLMNEYKQEQATLRDRLADDKHRIGLLEEGGLYADLLHKYQQLKYEFEEEAKEWAEFAVAKEILSKTVESYKTEKLPKLLTNASEYLRFLTNDEYERLIIQETGSGFLVERKDHTLFEVNELSQATAEQVYVSLRLALAVSLSARYPFPIIIDDSFVNFDESRAKRMFVLLRRFTNNQILFFTCHKHLLEDFHEEEMIRLTKPSAKLVM